MSCIFRHKRKYVALRHVRDHHYSMGEKTKCCCYGHTVARWVCERCGVMKEHELDEHDGNFKIEEGRLVPDHETYANWGQPKVTE